MNSQATYSNSKSITEWWIKIEIPIGQRDTLATYFLKSIQIIPKIAPQTVVIITRLFCNSNTSSHFSFSLRSKVTEIFSNHWEREAQESVFLDGEKPGYLKDEGIQLLATYHKNLAPKIQPVEVEREFLLDTGVTELPLKGYIDLIDDQHYIIDHKTSKRSFPKDAAERDIQLTAYAMAHRKLYG